MQIIRCPVSLLLVALTLLMGLSPSAFSQEDGRLQFGRDARADSEDRGRSADEKRLQDQRATEDKLRADERQKDDEERAAARQHEDEGRSDELRAGQGRSDQRRVTAVDEVGRDKDLTKEQDVAPRDIGTIEAELKADEAKTDRRPDEDVTAGNLRRASTRDLESAARADGYGDIESWKQKELQLDSRYDILKDDKGNLYSIRKQNGDSPESLKMRIPE